MTSDDTRRCEVLLSLQKALLGEVTPNLRAVTVRHDDASMHFEAFFDGPIGAEEREGMLLVETEVLAELHSRFRVTHALVRLDAPAPIPKDRAWVYFRKEPATPPSPAGP